MRDVRGNFNRFSAYFQNARSKRLAPFNCEIGAILSQRDKAP
jgi:hypothetical protein